MTTGNELYDGVSILNARPIDEGFLKWNPVETWS